LQVPKHLLLFTSSTPTDMNSLPTYKSKQYQDKDDSPFGASFPLLADKRNPPSQKAKDSYNY